MSLPATTAASGPASAGIELSKPQRKSLSSLGHHVCRLAAACDRLSAREPSFPELMPWLGPGGVSRKIALVGDGVFACPLLADGPRLTLHPLVAPTPQCAMAFRDLPVAAPEGATALALSEDLNAPLWLALLRLRPLRDFWERELRRATVDALLDLLPDAWLLNPAPLPPGSVIPRLELASWSQWDGAGRKFIPASAPDIASRLSDYPDTPGILTALPESSPAAVPILSFYHKSDARVEWLGATRAT